MEIVPTVELGVDVVPMGSCFVSSVLGIGAIAGTIVPFGLGRVPLAW